MKLINKNNFIIFPLCTFLIACGGGGGNSNESSTSNQPEGSGQSTSSPTCVGIQVETGAECIEVEGRKAYLSNAESPEGLAIILHGSPGSPKKVSTIFGNDLLNNEYQLSTLIPLGNDPMWGWNSYISDSNRDNNEVKYIAQLIDSVIANTNIPENKVYVMGYSAGGFMAYKLACEIPEKLSGIVSIAGQMRGNVKSCNNSTPIAVHHMHNPNDIEVPVLGRGEVTSLNKTINYFITRNGCSGAMETTKTESVIDSQIQSEEVSYLDCEYSFKYTKLNGVPHESNYKPEKILKQLSYMIKSE